MLAPSLLRLRLRQGRLVARNTPKGKGDICTPDGGFTVHRKVPGEYRQLAVLSAISPFDSVTANRDGTVVESFCETIAHPPKLTIWITTCLYLREESSHYKHWGTISKLVREGRIAFLYTDMGNERTLTFVDEKVSDIKTKRNIIYTSNIVDQRYRKELNGLEIFNPRRKSWYVYTTKKPDTYILKASHTPPPYPNLY